MSIIAIGGLNLKMSLAKIVKLLTSSIQGHFEALNFGPVKKGTKTCYLRLSPKLDPLQVIEKINLKQTSSFKPQAFMPKHVPDLPLAAKLKTIPNKMKKGIRAPVLTQNQLVVFTYGHIMREMQSKYTGLYKLSVGKDPKGHPRLLHVIGQTVYKRLMQIAQSSSNLDSVFQLSKAYRKKHPHFGDFQLILSSLHRLQDDDGLPRVQLQESELTAVQVTPYMIDNVPYDKVKAACNKYLGKITNKVLEHVQKVSTKVDPDKNSLEEAARVKVREQLNKLVPYLPNMINQVVHKHFIPQESDYYIVRVYGEPFLPGLEVMRAWARRVRGAACSRDARMYNMLLLRAPRDALPALLAADGELVGGAKLVIRPSDTPFHRIPVEELDDGKTDMKYEDPAIMEVDPSDEQQWSEQW